MSKQFVKYAFLVIPLNQSTGWNIEKFNKISAHQVSFTQQGMNISVDQSASPMFYQLKEIPTVTGFKAKVEFKRLPVFSDLKLQGEKNFDDFAMRIGLIEKGDKTLSSVSKLFASEWVKRLYAQVPENLGLEKVHFFNFVQNEKLVGQKREHPASELLEENFIKYLPQDGSYEVEYRFPNPIQTVALWISLDGDDTKSQFQVLFKELQLMTKE